MRSTPFFHVVLGSACLLWFSMSSCSVLNFTTTAEMTSSMDVDSVAIALDEWDWDEGFYYEVEGYDRVLASLSNSEEYHIVQVSKEGHFPQTIPLFPEQRNPLKLVDGGMTALGLGMMARGISQDGEDSGVWTGVGFGLAFYNGLGLFAPPKRVYKKSYVLPALVPMPTCKNDTSNLLIEGFHMRIDSANHQWSYYESMRDFETNQPDYTRKTEEAIELEYSNLDAEMTQQDKNSKLFEVGGAVKMAGALTYVDEHRVAGVVRYDVKSDWWMFNPYEMATDTLKLSSTSIWGPYDPTEGLDRSLISDALIHSLFEAMESPVIQESWVSEDEWAQLWKQDWSSISIPHLFRTNQKVAQAIPSVVTIDAEDGHGSGCIISSDGWIVTNHHVIADTSLSYEVHFEDGSKKKAEIERWEPQFDLALLKVDTTDLVPFSIDFSVDIPVGEEVYAIGTPFDVELGATLTKGIISGRRKDGNRMLIQTDVSISPGNSGGALVDENGVLIGIVNQKISGMGVEGIGFAIPTHYLENALGLIWEKSGSHLSE